MQKLVKATGFAPSELEFLHRRFRSLCKNPEGLSRSDITARPHFRANPYVMRLFGMMPKNEFGEVTFETFVTTAALFRPGKDVNQKLKFIFDLFDLDMDGSLSADDIADVLKIIQPDVADEERKAMVDKCVADVMAKVGGKHKDGNIYPSNFIAFAKTLPNLDSLLTLNLADEMEPKVD